MLHGNIFFRVQRAFNSNQGGDFNISNNLFVAVETAVAMEGSAQPAGSRAAAAFAQLDRVPFRGALWQARYPALRRFRNWTVPEQPPPGCLDGPLGNVLGTNLVAFNFTPPRYWGECECCVNGYHGGDVQHRRWLPGFCNATRAACAPGSAGIPNAGGGGGGGGGGSGYALSLVAQWANSSSHFDVRSGNAVLRDPQFESSNVEQSLNFTLRPTSPAFELGWQAIPEHDIGPPSPLTLAVSELSELYSQLAT